MSAPADLMIRARNVITGINAASGPEIVENGALVVRRGLIAAIGTASDLIARYPNLPIEGSDKHVAIPGLVNAHHHSGLTPLQLGVPFAPLELWLPQFMGMPRVDPRLDTLYSAVEMLESGTTAVQHIQGGLSGPPSGWSETANAIISAYGEIGMRVSYSFMFRDRNQLVFDDDELFLSTLPQDLYEFFGPILASSRVPTDDAIAFFRRLQREWAAREPDRVRVQFAPANLHWCSDAALEMLFAAARSEGAKLHMHLDETRLQHENANRITGHSAIRHLHRLGCLGSNLTLGHGIWADAGDLDLLAEHSTCLCHNASSGLRLASGIAPVNPARQRGIKVALGIDQCGVNDDRDMLQEMRVAWMIHREPGLFQDRPSTAEIFRMASENGADTTGFEGLIGRLAVGRAADIVLLDWNSVALPYMDARTPLLDALFHRAKHRSVDKVFVSGRRVVDNGRVCLIDREGLMSEIAGSLSSGKPRTRLHEMIDRLSRELEAYYRGRGETEGASRYVFNKFALESLQ
jgi:5-methylthioadenosine/S-adenosylhomocysteine deaminase